MGSYHGHQNGGRMTDTDFRANDAWLNGDVKAAAELFRESYQRSPNFGSCLSVMATADRLGDRATVEEYRKLLISKHRKEAPEIVRIIEILLDVLNSGKPRMPDLKAVDQALETMLPPRAPPRRSGSGCFSRGAGRRPPRGPSSSIACPPESSPSGTALSPVRSCATADDKPPRRDVRACPAFPPATSA